MTTTSFGCIVEAVAGGEVLCDRLTKRGDTGRTRVVVVVRVERCLCGLHDVRRGVEVRVSPTQGDDVVHACRNAEHPCAERAVFFDDSWG